MLRLNRPTLVIVAGCCAWLWSALPAPAQGHGQNGGKGSVHPAPGGGRLPHVPAQGAGNQHRSLPNFGVGQQNSGTTGSNKTGSTGAGKTLPSKPGGNSPTTGGAASSGTTTNNAFRGGFVNPLSGNQPGLINKVFGGPQQPNVAPLLQSGVLVGPYGNINLVGRWWDPVSPFSLLNGSAFTNNPLNFSSGFANPLLSSGFNSINYWGNNPFGLANSGLFGLNNPFFNSGFNSINYWGNNWLLGSNPFLQQYYNPAFGNPWQANPVGNVWSNPFANPWANPLYTNPFANPWSNPVLPTGPGANPFAPVNNNPFGGIRLF